MFLTDMCRLIGGKTGREETTRKDNIVTIFSDCRCGFELEIGFINHLQVVNTSNYNIIANSHNFTNHYCIREIFYGCCDFTSHFLVTASNSGDSSASVITEPTKSYLHRLPYTPLHSLTILFQLTPLKLTSA
jgi:hypothetical protein